MKSFTDQFISDLYGSMLHVETPSLTGVDVVYDGLGNASSLSVGLSGEGARITGALTSGNIVYPTYPSLINFIDYIYPIGSCLLSLDNANPSIRLLGTVWTQVGQGRVITGVGTGTDSNGVARTVTSGNNSGGLYQQTLSASNIPDHFHYIANTVSDHSTDKDLLTPDNYMALGGRAAASNYAYELEGNSLIPTVGKTSGLIGANQTSPVTTTNPTYGVYIWTRIS
jgi:microcystin-dependent protein